MSKTNTFDGIAALSFKALWKIEAPPRDLGVRPRTPEGMNYI
jgi:hypothetical protein